MKRVFNSIKYMFAATALLCVSCEPIEDNNELSNSFDVDKIELEAIQETPGGNQLTLKMKSKGVTGYWDCLIDKKYSDRATVTLPFTGTHTFTFHVTTPYINGSVADREYVSKSIDVEITTLDTKLNDNYYTLVGKELEGKTWVFNGVGGDNGVWWAMTSPGNPGEVWWNAAGTCCPPSDAAGKMVFDVNGGANYTYYSTKDGEPIPAAFSFSADFKRISFSGGANLLGAEAGGSGVTEYEILELTDDKMTLFSSAVSGGTGWIWVFVPEKR